MQHECTACKHRGALCDHGIQSQLLARLNPVCRSQPCSRAPADEYYTKKSSSTIAMAINVGVPLVAERR